MGSSRAVEPPALHEPGLVQWHGERLYGEFRIKWMWLCLFVGLLIQRNRGVRFSKKACRPSAAFAWKRFSTKWFRSLASC